MFVSRNSQSLIEASPHCFTMFASDEGISPAGFVALPGQLPTDLGNGQPLVIHHRDGGEAVYRQQFGCIQLTIWND